MKKVGYIDITYAEQRLIIEKLMPYVSKERIQYEYLNRENLDIVAKAIKWGTKLLYQGKHNFLTNLREFHYEPILEPPVDVIHTFNTVCRIKKPWVVSFESTIPRYIYARKQFENFYHVLKERGVEDMRRENCICLLPISNYTYHLQKKYFEYIGAKDLINKMKVLHPPQTIESDVDIIEKKYDDMRELRFLMVGHAFFVKGGREIAEVLSEFRKERDIKLTIVSSLINPFGQGEGFDNDDIKNFREFIVKNKEWITLYPVVSNRQVLNLARNAHIGLLPSYHDTYGYSVLEMQACGCPVITSDVRALPEINNNLCGWVSNIENVRKDGIQAMIKQNKKELYRIVEDILNGTGQIKNRACKSLQRIQTNHSPVKYGKKLMKVYREGFGYD